jgi:hypothetical protein
MNANSRLIREIILIAIGIFLALGFQALYDFMKEWATIHDISPNNLLIAFLWVFFGAISIAIYLTWILTQTPIGESRPSPT